MLRYWIELTKPERTLANVITASAGFFLASNGHFDWWLLLATLAGTTLVIASACVANNYLDRGIDSRMPRTKHRALVQHKVDPRATLVYSGALGLVGFGILWRYVNLPVVILGAIAYVDYVVLYAYSKRHTVHSTLIGTVSGAMSLVAGYVAVTGRIDTEALVLFLILALWQMPHFYAISIFRARDYAAANIPTMAVVAGNRSTKRWIMGYTLAFVGASGLLYVLGYAGSIYLLAVVLLGAYWLWVEFRGLGAGDDVAWARRVFKTSLFVLLIQSFAMALGRAAL